MPRFDNCLRDFLEKENISDQSSRLALKTRKSQVHQHHNTASFGLKNRKTQYGKVKRGENVVWEIRSI